MRQLISPNTARPHAVRTLWWCALAIAVSWVALSLARTRFSKEPDRVFAVDSLRPSAQSDDSWKPMIQAFDYLRSPHTTPVYTEIFLRRHVKFQYPLTTLLPLYLVRSRWALSTVSLVLIFLTLPLMVSLFKTFLGARELPATKMETFGRIALPVIMTLTLYPVIYAYRLGQLQSWLLLGFVLLVWLWAGGRTTAAGVVAALLTCAKPQFGLLFLWAATRRKWSFCVAFAITAVVALSMSIAVFGWREQIGYLNVLSVLSRHGESWFSNQSVNGILHRLMDRSLETRGDIYYLPPFNRTIYLTTLATSIALIAGALFVPAKFRGGVADLMVASLTLTAASPVAWTHHYNITLPMYAALFAWGTRRRPLGRWTLPTACLSYLLLGTYLGGFWKMQFGKLNVLQSYPFAGVLIGLALLYVWAVTGEPGGDAVFVAAHQSNPKRGRMDGEPISSAATA